jgi:hypothetical protein
MAKITNRRKDGTTEEFELTESELTRIRAARGRDTGPSKILENRKKLDYDDEEAVAELAAVFDRFLLAYRYDERGVILIRTRDPQAVDVVQRVAGGNVSRLASGDYNWCGSIKDKEFYRAVSLKMEDRARAGRLIAAIGDEDTSQSKATAERMKTAAARFREVTGEIPALHIIDPQTASYKAEDPAWFKEQARNRGDMTKQEPEAYLNKLVPYKTIGDPVEVVVEFANALRDLTDPSTPKHIADKLDERLRFIRHELGIPDPSDSGF